VVLATLAVQMPGKGSEKLRHATMIPGRSFRKSDGKLPFLEKCERTVRIT
jgi:hypothetical protein